MKKRIIITAIVVAVVHFVLAMGSLVFAIGAGMGAFDDPDYQTSGLERVTDLLVTVLLQPGMSLWTPWMSKNMPNLVEWLLLMANSLLWGFAITLIIRIPALVKKKGPGDNEAHSMPEGHAGRAH